MSATISSIRSVLIRTCMANVQKEISQLEHWLNNLSDDVSVHIPSHPIHSHDEQFELSNLNRVIERLVDETVNQRNTLNNILERLDNLEGFSRPNREVFIDENVKNCINHNDPWIDNNCEPLANEVVGEDDISEPIYTRPKSLSVESSVGTPSIIPDIPEDKSIIPDIDSDDDNDDKIEKVEFTPLQTNSKESDKTSITIKEEEEEQVEEEQVEEEQVEEDEKVVVEERKEVVETNSEIIKDTTEKHIQEEEEEEEDESEQEFEEIEYKGIRYYKDNENFIYSVDDEDQPSENPVGYWKEKIQSIAFYKTK